MLAIENSNLIINTLLTLTASFGLVYLVIPTIAKLMLNNKISGRDLNKKSNGQIPESVGAVTSITYFVALPLYLYFLDLKNDTLTLQFSAFLFYVVFVTAMGLYDDIYGMRWRYKILFPFIATIPVLVVYELTGGRNYIPVAPAFMMFGLDQIELSYFYCFCISLMLVFCTNAVNIFAGINGLETGQSLVVGCFLILFNYLQLNGDPLNPHFFSFLVLVPFVSTTFALFLFNKYPSSVFVGDVFTLFSGVVLGMSSVFGNYTHVIFFFLLPQLVNFVYSLPQLLGFIKCPTHRVPIFDPQSKKLRSSKNLTLINLFLEVFGPMGERDLCYLLLGFQAICCSVTIVVFEMC